MRTLFVFVLFFYAQGIFSQSCSETDFVLSKDGNLFLHLGPNSGRSEKPIVIGDSTSLLQDEDSLLISGGLRFQPNVGQVPTCEPASSGSLWYSNQGGSREGDSLRYCDSSIWGEVEVSETTFGPAVRDSWGFTFDSWDRPSLTWEEASKVCTDLGGRLPTVTELFRNNQKSGTSLISNYPSVVTQSAPLWSIIPGVTSGEYGTVRLSDGTIGYSVSTTPQNFRCVWGLPPQYSYSQTNCYGPNGSECQTGSRWYNVDRFVRPNLPYSVALQECLFHGGSLPTFQMWQDLVLDSSFTLDLTTASLSSLNVGFPGNSSLVQTVLDFSAAKPINSNWILEGATSGPTVASPFICVGLNPSVPKNIPMSPSCQGNCLYFATSRGITIIDGQDRTANHWLNASKTCDSLGGKIPGYSILFELIHKGLQLPNFVWTSEVGMDGYLMTISNNGLNSNWNPSDDTLQLTESTTDTEYRCMWSTSLLPLDKSFQCTMTQTGIEDSNFNLACLDTVNGNSNNNHHGGDVFLDSFGYAWDREHRDAATFQTAFDTCQNLGGRLPLPTEIFRSSRLRTPLPNVNRLPGVTADRDLDSWTLLPSEVAGFRATVTLAGNSAQRNSNDQLKYRCVWGPTPKDAPSLGMGNVFGGHKCLGDPLSPGGNLCFRAGQMVVDSYDRTPLRYVSAAAECQFLGGRLPSFEEMMRLISRGAPNGYNNFAFGASELQVNYGLWLSQPGYDSTDASPYLLARWFGNQEGNWTLSFGDLSQAGFTVGTSTPDQLNSFRCVWNLEL